MVGRLAGRTLVALVVAAGLGGPLFAQAQRPRVNRVECSIVERAFRATPPPSPTDRSWQLLRACGRSGGAALAAAVGQLGRSSDSTLLDVALRTIAIFHDASVLDAMRQLASDTLATPESRTTALHGMLLYHRPQLGLQPMRYVVAQGRGPCYTTVSYDRLTEVVGAPLPSDFRERIAATARAETSSTRGDPIVQAAARCLLWHISPAVAPDIDPSAIRLTHVCGDKFRVHNPNTTSVMVEYDVEGTTERFKLSVRAGGERFFFAQNAGRVRLFYDGALRETHAGRDQQCPS